MLKDLESTVIEKMEKMKPKEISTVFTAYVEKKCVSPELLARLEYCVKSKYVEFWAEDVTMIYESMSELEFPIKGEIWAKM